MYNNTNKNNQRESMKREKTTQGKQIEKHKQNKN